MTIWMITREVETETGNGSVYDEYVDEDFGYFTSQVVAENKLADIVDEEKERHQRNWKERTHAQWVARKKERDRISFQNSILKENGIPDSSLTPVPHLWDEPVYPGWKAEFSAYNITTIEEGVV